jgi:DNA-binding NtrC family response regulator
VRGNKAVAARLLGISRRAFYRQLERHGLHRSTTALKCTEVSPIVRLGRVS